MASICIDSHIHIKGLSLNQRKEIEKELTFDNPKYASIMKFSKWGSTREPQYIEYFSYHKASDGQLEMTVPRGFNISNSIMSNSEIKTELVYEKIENFPKFILTLRETQEQALESFISSNQNPLNLSGSIQLPTGKGKTILGIAISAFLKAQTLIIVHKDDLVTGWKNDIEKAFNGKADIGLIKAKSRKVGNHFTIATIQTLNRLTEKELKALYSKFSFIIQDEMHHCPSTSFSLANNFKARYRLGLTATPERNDGLAHIMNLYFGDFCFKYTHREDDEDILPVKVIKRTISTYFDPVALHSKGEYSLVNPLEDSMHFNPDYILKDDQMRFSDIPHDIRLGMISHVVIDKLVVNHPNTMSKVCMDIMSEYNKGHSCIAFFTEIESVDNYFNYLTHLGVPESDIGLYYGNNKNCDAVRETASTKRKYITLATFSKATEGTNVNQWEVGFLVSSINNGKNVEQAVGRIRRTMSGDKLSTALLYDYRYTYCIQLSRHGATRDLRYSLLRFSFKHEENKSLFSKGFRS